MYFTYSVYLFILTACTFVHAIEDYVISESATSNELTTEIYLPSTPPPPSTDTITTSTTTTTAATAIGCSCGVFLSGQFNKGTKEQPKENPSLLLEQPEKFPCTNAGNKLCMHKCLENIVKYLPKSSSILCASIDRNCFKEKAHLFIRNCKNEWINTNLSAGREYCCKDGNSYKCPHV
ncbi:follicle cell protein 3C-1 [Copidosoma floridanum]|uniref:follicle cell protein 3C-1 n=1 Tax=Copidosoma floridanum TaxID=29053 RepID=UPI0006C9C102|nr:follicle cell protein 3C-1 [Copidosoma floridanum]XP_014214311.1 follicle cell protein 3C-1 [Copidosoma floridanum]